MTTNLTNLTNGADWPRRAQLHVRVVREVRGQSMEFCDRSSPRKRAWVPAFAEKSGWRWADD